MASKSLKNMEEVLDQDELSAYNANCDVFKVGLNSKEVAEYYNHWAKTGDYDLHLNPDRYRGPECTARALANHYSTGERQTARILDVAAGTGRVGAELQKLGFRNLDALDPSEGMLRKAEERGIYTNIFQSFFGLDSPVPVDDDFYDGLVVCGGFGEGHIPVSALHEMIRVVKPGGMVCIAMRESYLEVPQYKGTLEPLMKDLESAGQWKLLKKDTIPNYFIREFGALFQFVIV